MAGKTLLDEIGTLVRATDTFEWLTTEVAKGLDHRAETQEVRITEVSRQLVDPSHPAVFERAARLARAEAAAQRRLARWLRSLNPDSNPGDN